MSGGAPSQERQHHPAAEAVLTMVRDLGEIKTMVKVLEARMNAQDAKIEGEASAIREVANKVETLSERVSQLYQRQSIDELPGIRITPTMLGIILSTLVGVAGLLIALFRG